MVSSPFDAALPQFPAVAANLSVLSSGCRPPQRTGGAGSSPRSPESSPSKPYDPPSKPFQGASPGLTSSRRRHSLTNVSRELLSSSGLGSQSSLTPVLEHKPDLSSHVPPAFSLGIIAGGEPGPPAPMYTAAPGMPGGKPMGWAHSPARGAREGDSCAKVCSGAAARSFGRLAQALAFAALLLLAMVAGLAAWPHHGRSGRDPKQGSQYAAGGLATDVDPIPELPRRFLERITGGGQAGSARDRRSVYDMRLEALTAGQAGARGAGLGLALAEAGAEGGEAEKAEVLTRDAVAAERLHLAMKAAAADASSAGARARAKLTSVAERMQIMATNSMGSWPFANPAAADASILDGREKPRRALRAADPAADLNPGPDPVPERLLLAPVAEPPKEATNTGGALAGVTGGTATMGGTDGSTVTKRSHPDVGSIDVSKSAQDAMTHVVASGSGLLDNKDMSADQLSTKRPSPIGGASLGGVANPVQSATLTIVRGGGAGGSGGPQRVVWDPSTAVTTPQNTAPSATPAPMPNAPWWVTESGR